MIFSLLHRFIPFSSRSWCRHILREMVLKIQPGERHHCRKVSLQLLKKPLTFPVAKNLIAKNRLIKAPMIEQLATFDPLNSEKSGLPTDGLLHMNRKFAEGGCGINVTGCIVVSDNGIICAGNAIISKKHNTSERMNLYKKLASCAVENSLIIGQIVHPGRRLIKIGKQDVIPFNAKSATISEIHSVIEQHVYAAQYLYDAGFHGVELNASLDFAFGEMISANNTRTDSYGGSLENRSRIILETIKKIRNSINDDENFIIGLKLSSPNFEAEFDEDEYMNYCKKLDQSGLDYVSVAGGHYHYLERFVTGMVDSCKRRETFYVRFAELTRRFLKKVRIIRCGGFLTAEQIYEVLLNSSADAVGMGRALAAEPDLPKKLLDGEVLSAKKCIISDLDFAKRKEAAGTQLWQIANNLKLLDLTNEHHVTAFGKALENHKNSKTETNANYFGYTKLDVEKV